MKISPFYRKSTVFLRFSHKSKWHLWATPFQIQSSFWNDDKKEVRASHPDAYDINKKLNEYKVLASDLFIKKRMNSSKELKEYIDTYGFDDKTKSMSFVQFAESIKETKSKLDQKNYRSMIHWVKEFEPKIGLGEWTTYKLDQFLEFLLNQDSISSKNTTGSYMKKIRVILNKALQYDYIQENQNPFNRGYKIQHGATKDVKLDIEQISKLKKAVKELDTNSKKEAAISFLLAFAFDGLRVSDLYLIKKGMFVGDKLKLFTKKTGKYKELSLTSFSLDILKELEIDKLTDDEYIFPAVRRQSLKRPIDEDAIESVNAYVNKNLKFVAQELNLPEDISMHAARHTLAYLADEMGANITSIQQALTHSSISETSKYIGRLRGDKFAENRQILHDKI